MLTCPKCNFENELGRIFCHQCGTKLDLDQIKPPSRGGKSLKKSKWSGGRLISLSIRLIVLAALVLGLVLMALVPVLDEIPTTPRDVESFYRKRSTLEKATFQSKPVEVLLTEAELNSYIDNVSIDKAEGTGIKVEPTNIQIDLDEDAVTVTVQGQIVIAEKFEKALSISYTGRPTIEEGKFVFRPQTAHIGKLPIARLILEKTSFVESYFVQVFHQLTAEKQMLEKLAAIKIEDGQAILTYGGTRAEAPPTN